jgi:hypothetical protein
MQPATGLFRVYLLPLADAADGTAKTNANVESIGSHDRELNPMRKQSMGHVITLFLTCRTSRLTINESLS